MGWITTARESIRAYRRDPVRALRSPTLLAALACAVLPFALLAGGLTMTSATDVVIFAVACMALNLLVGRTGLVDGHLLVVIGVVAGVEVSTPRVNTCSTPSTSRR